MSFYTRCFISIASRAILFFSAAALARTIRYPAKSNDLTPVISGGFASMAFYTAAISWNSKK
jgi:hypothetical protein